MTKAIKRDFLILDLDDKTTPVVDKLLDKLDLSAEVLQKSIRLLLQKIPLE